MAAQSKVEPCAGLLSRQNILVMKTRGICTVICPYHYDKPIRRRSRQPSSSNAKLSFPKVS